MLKNNYNHSLVYLFLILLLNSALAIYPVHDYLEENPIQELYQEVTPDYMREVLENISSLFEPYVFSDILKSPPSPYDNISVNVLNIFENIKINTTRPFYEFFRDVKIALSFLRDSNFEIIGGEIPLDSPVNFRDYRMCLPFRFYLDKDEDNNVKIFIEEYEPCSKYYLNETETLDFIRNHNTTPVQKSRLIFHYSYR